MKKTALAIALLAAGCSWLPDHSLDYRQAPLLEPMAAPEGGAFIGEKALYPVPDQDKRLVGKQEGERSFKAPRPPQLVVLGNAPDEDDTADPAPKDQGVDALLGKDGNGYPIIMLSTRYPWAWEYIGDALAETDLKISDRDREVGIYFLQVPERYQLEEQDAQIKLSHTSNGIQVAVLNKKGTALVEEAPGQAMLERIYQELP